MTPEAPRGRTDLPSAARRFDVSPQPGSIVIQHAPDQPRPDLRDPLSRQAFLSSHRALAVCTRELARLSDQIIMAAREYARVNALDVPTVRKAPDRCIVQVGPVALTVAWLRNGSDAPAAGELLAIVWRGIIAPRGDHLPERLGARRVPPVPVSVWEETLVASATSEATWHWHPVDLTREGYASSELAVRCMEQVQAALEAIPADTP